MPAMATGTVADERTERKRELETAKNELETAKNELETAMARYAAAEVAASAGGGPDSHPALADRRIRRTALSSARSGLEAAYRADRSDCGSGNAPACAGCGERMRYVGRGGSPVETAPGRVEVSMARHACAACRKTVRPRERALDIEGSTTPAARRMASLAGSSCCHGEADRLLAELAEVNFGAKARRGRRGVERTTRLVGDDAESRRKASLSGALSAASGAGGGGAPARRPLKDGGILCVALDGTGVPARPSETAGRAGKDGGRAGTREAKVGAPWLLEPDGEGGMRTADGSVRYFAGVESAEDDAGGDSPVARRLLRELAAAGHAPDDVGVCIGDGAEWLRRLFDEWFPNAVPIVDFLHASEYLWAAAGGRHGAGDGRAKQWATELCRLLKEGDAGKVVAALRRAGGEECGRAARHIGERRDRMRCDEHPARGLPIGSGRVEAACRTVVGRRMKCTGMRWSVDGANPVPWVRCARLSGWFDDYWDERLPQAA